MLRRFKSKRAIAALSVVGVLALAVGAYAYFSSTGTGTGSATTGSSTAFTVASTADTGGDLVPNDAIGTGVVDTIHYSVTNPSTGKQNLNHTVISVAGAGGSAWSARADQNKPACTASDFSVGGATVGTSLTSAENAGDLTAGQTVNNSVSLQMVDNGQNQDNCQGVTVPLYFSAS